MLERGVADVRTIVMSIRPRHLRNMATGLKPYELRKTKPREAGEYRVMLCESGKSGVISATFICRSIVDMRWMNAMRIAQLACITAAEASEYRRKGREGLYGWQVEDFQSLKGQGLYISDFGLDRAPQSWCYARTEPDGRGEAGHHAG